MPNLQRFAAEALSMPDEGQPDIPMVMTKLVQAMILAELCQEIIRSSSLAMCWNVTTTESNGNGISRCLPHGFWKAWHITSLGGWDEKSLNRALEFTRETLLTTLDTDFAL